MKIRFRISLHIFIFFVFISSSIIAQSFTTYLFNNEDGLVSNLVKNVTQDKNGFIWIATDAGLSKFNGKDFINYQSNLPSLYIKDIYCTEQNKINVVTDMGIGYFLKKDDGYHYQSIIGSSIKENDSTLYYPKNVTQTEDHSIWVGDLNGISRIKNGIYKKYVFPAKYHADSYFRAFSLAQDKQTDIVATSRNGYIFLYNRKHDKFNLLPFRPPDKAFGIDAITPFEDNSFLIGTTIGLYKLTLNSGKSMMKMKKIFDIQNISSVIIKDRKSLFVGTWNGEIYYDNLNGKSENPIRIFRGDGDDNFGSIKSLFIDRDSNLWVSSDEGVAIIKETMFNPLSLHPYPSDGDKIFVQQIQIDNKNNVFFTDGTNIYKESVKQGKREVSKYLSTNINDILTFALTKKGIWISYRNNYLEYRDRRNLKLIHSIKLQDDRFNTLYVDKNDDLWSYLARRDEIVKIDKSFKPTYYQLKNNDLVFMNVFKESKDGTLYCAGSGVNSFLFKFDKQKNKFINISPKLSFGKNSSIQVFDMAITDSALYLATGFGVVELRAHKGKFIDKLINIENGIARAITFDKNNVIWVGTERGVYVYYKNHDTYFNKNDGLPNSSVVNQGIIFDRNNNMWVATASGVAYSNHTDENIKKTPTPFFTNIKELLPNGKDIKGNGRQYISGVNLEFIYNSLIFPNGRTYYQYRLLGIDTTWSNFKTANFLNFFSLPSGNYKLQVRAKSVGHFLSDISEYKFDIVPHWYFSVPMIIFYILASILLVIIVVNRLNSIKYRRLQDRQNELAHMVNEKTNDLLIEKERVEKLLTDSEKSKKQLEEANEQKSNILSIAAHDLKNPLQALIGFSSIIEDESTDSDIKNMSHMIYDSSKAMLGQINEMLEAAAMESKNLSLDLKKENINEIVNNVIKSHYDRAKQKEQFLVNKFDDNVETVADKHWLSIAVDNLISNAIKYSDKGSAIYISTSKEGDKIYIKVKDQGPGLTQDDMIKLFRKYQRLSARPTAGETSTGLGLSIVKDIIDKHNGKVWAECSDGKGATFTIMLPSNNNKDVI